MTTSKFPTRENDGIVIKEYGDYDFAGGYVNGWAVYDRAEDLDSIDHVFVSSNRKECEAFIEGWRHGREQCARLMETYANGSPDDIKRAAAIRKRDPDQSHNPKVNAVPDLIAALEEWERLYSTHGLDTILRARLLTRKALAKARG